jgi:hypothetical protein
MKKNQLEATVSKMQTQIQSHFLDQDIDQQIIRIDGLGWIMKFQLDSFNILSPDNWIEFLFT